MAESLLAPPPSAADTAVVSPWSLGTALAAAGSAVDLESTTRPLLEALQELTGLTTTFLAAVDWDAGTQVLRYARTTGGPPLPEGIAIAWEDTLCRRALEEDIVVVDDVQVRWPDNAIAAALGVQTYATAPVTLADGSVWGTLCGASNDSVVVDEGIANVVRAFARIIADAVAREQALLASRDRAQRAEELLRERARFLGIAEHQCKSPLAVIVGWGHMLRSDVLDEPGRIEGIDAIVASAERLSDQLGRLLGEATAQSLAVDLDLGPVDLGGIVTDVASELSVLSDRHDLVVEVTEGVVVEADQRAIRIMLEHLVENAITYAPDGGAVVLRVARDASGAGVLAVVDSGVGMPDDVDVFAPFVRGTTEVPGSGLGLHVVASLVQAMAGTVRAARRDVGSEVVVTLPAA